MPPGSQHQQGELHQEPELQAPVAKGRFSAVAGTRAVFHGLCITLGD